MPACKICKNIDGNKTHQVREMMFGFRDKFEYIECLNCGCLQIKEVPADLSKYYPNDYYSLKKKIHHNDSPFQSLLKRQRASYGLFGKNIIGWAVSKAYGVPNWYKWLRRVGVNFSSSILDVGCGTGDLLLGLRKEGFTSLIGVDPFIKKDIDYENGVTVLKKDLGELDERFDFIMMHHSFEHMSEPLKVLKKIHQLLKPGRFVLIRIPIASSFAWKKYGKDWVELDAPRHLFLHTTKSMEILAEQAGLKMVDVVFDSKDMQFWGSEQYRRDIPLMDAMSYKYGLERSIFSKEEIDGFKAQAKELNQKKEGDQACFYFYKETQK